MEKTILEKLLEIAKIDPNFTIDYGVGEIRYVDESEARRVVTLTNNFVGGRAIGESNQLKFFLSQRVINETTYTNNDDTLIRDLEIEIKKRSLEAELIPLLNIALIRLYQNFSGALKTFSDIFGEVNSNRKEIQRNPSSRLQLEKEGRVIRELEELFKKNIILLPIDFNELFSKAKQVAESTFRNPETIKLSENATIAMFQTTLKFLILSQDGDTKQALEKLSAKFEEVFAFRRSLDEPSGTVDKAKAKKAQKSQESGVAQGR
jgi:hypothetical protein